MVTKIPSMGEQGSIQQPYGQVFFLNAEYMHGFETMLDQVHGKLGEHRRPMLRVSFSLHNFPGFSRLDLSKAD